MDADFWHGLWADQDIGFHQENGNPLLARHFSALDLPTGARIFVPLCGKTGDIGWLLAQGHTVAGCELSETAVQQLFAELGVTPQITDIPPLKHYAAPGLDIYVGDIFALTRDTLGPVAATYDRAALVALPESMRADYAAHLADMTAGAPQLLITFAYDQSEMDGPPFAIPASLVQKLYGVAYQIAPLEEIHFKGLLRGEVEATEAVYLLA